MLALFGAATGCEVENEKVVEKAKLEKSVEESVIEQGGAKAGVAVRCPGDLEGKVGAKTRCTIVATDGSEVDVSVRIRDIEGDDVKFDIKVANKVRGKYKKAALEQAVKKSLAEQKGQAPKAIRCPGDLEVKVGAKTRCTLVDLDDSELDVDVRVSNDQGKLAFKVGNERR